VLFKHTIKNGADCYDEALFKHGVMIPTVIAKFWGNGGNLLLDFVPFARESSTIALYSCFNLEYAYVLTLRKLNCREIVCLQ